MLCRMCESGRWSPPPARRPAGRSRLPACDRCGGVILTLEGVAVGLGDDTLAQLARFGLAVTGRPLLELRGRET